MQTQTPTLLTASPWGHHRNFWQHLWSLPTFLLTASRLIQWRCFREHGGAVWKNRVSIQFSRNYSQVCALTLIKEQARNLCLIQRPLHTCSNPFLNSGWIFHAHEGAARVLYKQHRSLLSTTPHAGISCWLVCTWAEVVRSWLGVAERMSFSKDHVFQLGALIT